MDENEVERLRAEERRLPGLYWERPAKWTRAGDILHKYAIAQRLKAVRAKLDALRERLAAP